MRTATLDKRIILQQRSSGQGHSGAGTIASAAEVYASVRMPSNTFRSNMAASGLDVSLTVLVWRSEFCRAAYTHAVVDGKAYRIAATGAGINDLFVCLVLERG